MRNTYLVGYDLGSSSVKASLIDAANGNPIAAATSPVAEMEIQSPRPGFAEQHPRIWWENLQHATHQLLAKARINHFQIQAIGISYQMHGLVAVDKHQEVVRPAIIWCDSRAVEIGNAAFASLGEEYCLEHLMNSPGNFTASKLAWIRENEPAVYEKIDKIMLPGDWLALQLTGELCTTISGLSEGMMWDYSQQSVSERLLEHYGIDRSMIPAAAPAFSNQGRLTARAANELGLAPGTPVTYRAGDQANNAFSLNVVNPGETATTAGTSGVIYSVINKPVYDKLARVNTFVHVTHQKEGDRYGVLLCVNGTGILNNWLRKNFQTQGNFWGYWEMNQMASKVPVGSEGLCVLPFGNGAERMLQNKNIGASFHCLDLNQHTQAHLCRAVQEGIVFSLGYGFRVFKEMKIHTHLIRAGHANMFLSPVFCETFAHITQTRLELYNTDGAQGAARGAGIGAGYYQDFDQAFQSLTCLKTFEPEKEKQPQYLEAFERWQELVANQLR